MEKIATDVAALLPTFRTLREALNTDDADGAGKLAKTLRRKVPAIMRRADRIFIKTSNEATRSTMEAVRRLNSAACRVVNRYPVDPLERSNVAAMIGVAIRSAEDTFGTVNASAERVTTPDPEPTTLSRAADAETWGHYFYGPKNKKTGRAFKEAVQRGEIHAQKLGKLFQVPIHELPANHPEHPSRVG
jgi:hypothetical protein